MSNIFDTEDAMSRLTFQERMLWAQLVAILAVGVFYVHFLNNAPPGHHYLHAVILGVLLIFGSVSFVARRRGSSGGGAGVIEDERDRSIAAIGARWSNVILWLGLVIILVLYWDHGTIHSASLVIGLIFHLLLLAGIARIVRELVAYRINA
jgi:drug/metabolite transporter (DMT)-like permease